MLASKQITKLVECPGRCGYTVFEARLPRATASSCSWLTVPDAWLARHAGGKLELLYRIPVKNYQQTGLRVEYVRGDRVLFQVSTGPDYREAGKFPVHL